MNKEINNFPGREYTSKTSGTIREGYGERHLERYFVSLEAERSGKERPTPGPAPSKEIYYLHVNKIKRSTGKNPIQKTGYLR